MLTCPIVFICPLCVTNEIEDEYHFVLICPFYIDLRVHLPQRYTANPSRNKFNTLMSSNKTPIIKSLAFYVHNAFTPRDSFLSSR